jgi:hypothetical protein
MEVIAMLHRSKLVLTLAVIAASPNVFFPGAATAQSSDPFVDHIVRVVYRWDSRASWGFMVYTDRNGQRCFRFGYYDISPKINDIMRVDHKVCFAPGQTTIERSPISTSVTNVAGEKEKTTIETYYSGSVRQAGNALDMTFQGCNRLRGEPDFRCVKPAHYVVRLRSEGRGCEVDVTDDRSTWKIVSKECEYYPAN